MDNNVLSGSYQELLLISHTSDTVKHWQNRLMGFWKRIKKVYCICIIQWSPWCCFVHVQSAFISPLFILKQKNVMKKKNRFKSLVLKLKLASQILLGDINGKDDNYHQTENNPHLTALQMWGLYYRDWQYGMQKLHLEWGAVLWYLTCVIKPSSCSSWKPPCNTLGSHPHPYRPWSRAPCATLQSYTYTTFDFDGQSVTWFILVLH